MKHLMSFIAAAFLASAAAAHGGEDHGDGAVPAATGDVAPRAFAQSEEFELVAVLADGKLTLYLDRYADNVPITDAQIEVESGAAKALAKQIAPGVYALPGEAFAAAGKHPLTFTVQAGEQSDLLAASLDIAPEAHPAESGWPAWATWGGAGTLLLAGTTVFALRRRKNHEEWK